MSLELEAEAVAEAEPPDVKPPSGSSNCAAADEVRARVTDRTRAQPRIVRIAGASLRFD
jgi:hypothetical protein